MLEARIVAIKTHGPLHGWPVSEAERAADSSHGDLMSIVIRESISVQFQFNPDHPHSRQIKPNSN
jgi:hypothetical protein